jgi:hypothetical protein
LIGNFNVTLVFLTVFHGKLVKRLLRAILAKMGIMSKEKDFLREHHFIDYEKKEGT